MTATVTKTFEFSASHAHGDKVIGHNYTLRAVFQVSDEHAETGLSDKIEKCLIQKVHSRDLGQHVDFLKGAALNELALLKAFWAVIEPSVHPTVLHSLSLERDRRTLWTLTASG